MSAIDRSLPAGIWRNRDAKFDLQLSRAMVRERKLAEILAHAQFHTAELKSERLIWERTGNLCIEFARCGQPSGIATTAADVWIHELVDYRDGSTLGYFLLPIDRMKQLARRAFREQRIKRGGDGDEFDVVLVPIEWLLKPSRE
jgi:hypothetical protein